MRQALGENFPFSGFLLWQEARWLKEQWAEAPRTSRKPSQQCDSTNGGGVSDPDLDPSWVQSVRLGLVAWYRDSQRGFPWRQTNDPYRILVSEMMLVQTTATAVVPYFERFLDRFPDVQALANAREVDVLRAWEGLGYYRRARQLQAASRAIVEQHGGAMPRDLESLKALPGVGRYVAGAILSFAFDLPAPIVEANSQRVLARLVAWRGDVKTSTSRARLWSTAEQLVPPKGAGNFNQGIMDLGALISHSSFAFLFALVPCPRLCGQKNRDPGFCPRREPETGPLGVTEACRWWSTKGQYCLCNAATGLVGFGSFRRSTSREPILQDVPPAYDGSLRCNRAVNRDPGADRARDQEAELHGNAAQGGVARTPCTGLLGQVAAGSWHERRGMGAAARPGKPAFGLACPQGCLLASTAFPRASGT